LLLCGLARNERWLLSQNDTSDICTRTIQVEIIEAREIKPGDHRCAGKLLPSYLMEPEIRLVVDPLNWRNIAADTQQALSD
jgi:hypothetical protein